MSPRNRSRTNASEFDRLDAQNQRHEDRRDELLQQIERRRSGWAKQVRRASEDIVDAEFKELTPNALTGRRRGSNSLLVKDDELSATLRQSPQCKTKYSSSHGGWKSRRSLKCAPAWACRAAAFGARR